jgi:hypothetical protein
MKKTLSIVTLVTVLLFALTTLAADKVVVVPLGGKKPTGDAVAPDVREGKTFSNKNDVGITGTMPIQTLDPASTNVPEGYYNSTDLATVDTDLTANNIRKGKDVYGVPGTVGIAYGCTPNSDAWDQAKCETGCIADTGGAWDNGCLNLCQNIADAFTFGFIPASLGNTLKAIFCGGQE